MQAAYLPEMTALALVHLREPPAKVLVHRQLSAVLAVERLMCCALLAVLQPACPALDLESLLAFASLSANCLSLMASGLLSLVEAYVWCTAQPGLD